MANITSPSLSNLLKVERPEGKDSKGRPVLRQYKTTLSINDIRSAAWNATQGSEESYAFLQEQNRRLAKLANSRLRALKNAKLDMFAYDRAITYLKNNDRKYFSWNLAPSTDFRGMVEQLSQLTTFINAPSSTVTGARRLLDDRLEKISQYTGHTYTDEQRLALGRLLGNDSISTLLRDVRGDSGDVIEFLEEVAATDVQTSDIVSIVDKYLAGYQPWQDAPWVVNRFSLNYDEMMKELWTEIGDEDKIPEEWRD